MTPVFCAVKHAPPDTYGDCLRACVASVLSADDVPHFYADGCDASEGNVRLSAFLATLGFAPFFAHYDGSWSREQILEYMSEQNPDVYYILYGSTGFGDHVVVCRGGAVVHNPSWDASPLIGPGSHGHWTMLVVARS